MYEMESIASMLGLSYNEFWYDNPDKYNFAYSGFERSRLLSDIQNWELGQYIQIACSGAFNGKKGAKYPKKPMFTKHLQEQHKTSQNDTNSERIHPMKQQFLNQMNAVNKTLRNKPKNGKNKKIK